MGWKLFCATKSVKNGALLCWRVQNIHAHKLPWEEHFQALVCTINKHAFHFSKSMFFCLQGSQTYSRDYLMSKYDAQQT